MERLINIINPWTIFYVLLFPTAANVFATWLPASASRLVGLVTFAVLAAVTISYLILLSYNRIVPLRFANLIYVLDDECNLAVISHPFYKRFMPPGSRLGFHEAPHRAVPRVLREELGLEANYFTFWPYIEWTQYGPTEIVQPPYQVQVETRPHRLGVSQHYDFVYVGRVKGVTPRLRSQLHPQWKSLEDLKELRRIGAEEEPFADIIPTFERIREAMRSLS